MLTNMRKKLGTIVVGLIVGLLVLVFAFVGVDPASPSNLGTAAGSVNGQKISLTEFNRAVEQRLGMFQGMNLSEDQIKQFRIRESVFDQLVSQKLMAQGAIKMGLAPSDEELFETIRRIKVFYKDGGFDPQTYRDVLAANRLTPSGYEKMVMEGLAVDRARAYFRQLPKVSKEEINMRFIVTTERRKIRYAEVTSKAARARVKINSKEVDALLKDENRKKVVETRYNGGKKTTYKGKSFDAAKRDIAKDILAGGKTKETAEATEKLIAEVVALFTKQGQNKAALTRSLKAMGLELKESKMISMDSGVIPGLGGNEKLIQDAFSKNGVIDITAKGAAKIYSNGASKLVAAVVEKESASMAKFNNETGKKLREELLTQKESSLFSDWLKRARDAADISRNGQLFDEQA